MGDLIAADGKLKWSTPGVYRFEKTGEETFIVHVDGARVLVPVDFVWKNTHALQDNYSDLAASIIMGSLTPIKCKTFVGKNVGPNTTNILNKKSQVTNALAADAKAHYDSEAQAQSLKKSHKQQIAEVVKENEEGRKRRMSDKRGPPKAPPLKKVRSLLGDVLTPTKPEEQDGEEQDGAE